MAVHERAHPGAANAAALGEQLLYPQPEGTHAQILADREAFDRALKRVHEHFDITEKLPKVGGRELDLYHLYRNVTELGGCAQVIAKKQWRVRGIYTKSIYIHFDRAATLLQGVVTHRILYLDNEFAQISLRLTPFSIGCCGIFQVPRHHNKCLVHATQGVLSIALGLGADVFFPGIETGGRLSSFHHERLLLIGRAHSAHGMSIMKLTCTGQGPTGGPPRSSDNNSSTSRECRFQQQWPFNPA